MRIVSSKPDQINGRWVVIVTDSKGEEHVIGCRSHEYCVELNTTIALGIMTTNASPETATEVLVLENLNRQFNQLIEGVAK